MRETKRDRWALWLGRCLLVLMGVGLLGCHQPKRFQVPDYKRKRGKIKKRYEVKGKVALPRGIPAWSEVGEKHTMKLFRPEPIRVKGALWLREGSSVIHTYYFRRTNHIAVRECLQVTDSIARFVSGWFGRSFGERLQVVLVPESDPADRLVAFKKKREPIPEVGSPRLVIYTGTDRFPYLAKHGFVGYIIEKTVRVMLTGTSKPDIRQFWRSIVIPSYFRLRGTGAMVDLSYDKTSRPRFLASLREAGRPDAKEMKRLIKQYEGGKLPWLARWRAIELLASSLGFLEDAYGRKAMAAVVRHQQKDSKRSMEDSLKAVIGIDWATFWKQWELYYYSDLWRLIVEGMIQ